MKDTPGAEDLRRSAATLNAALGIREAPPPPYVDGIDRDELAKHTWNQTVEMLRELGGPERLTALISRLQIREGEMPYAGDVVDALEQAASQYVNHQGGYKTHRDDKALVALEAVMNGGLTATGVEWSWRAHKREDGSVSRYSMALLQSNGALREVGEVEVTPDHTWQDVLNALTNAVDEVARTMDMRSVVRFRRLVAEQVMREYDILGYVGMFEERGEVPYQLSTEQRQFVRSALRAIALANAGRDGVRKSVRSVLLKTSDLMGPKPNGNPYGIKILKRFATELGAFKGLEGQPSREGGDAETARFDHLREMLQTVAVRARMPIPGR